MPLFPGSDAVSEVDAGNIYKAPMRQGDAGIAAWKEHLLSKIRAVKPELIIISAGFDAHADDPLAGLELQADDFYDLTVMIRQLAEGVAEGRLVSLLEGGYDLAALDASVTAHLNALE